MTNTWLLILIAMIGGNFILEWLPAAYYIPGVMVVNLAILFISWFCFKRDPFSDVRANMLFMLGLTVINILTDLGIMSVAMSWVAFGALFVWSMMGGGRSR